MDVVLSHESALACLRARSLRGLPCVPGTPVHEVCPGWDDAPLDLSMTPTLSTAIRTLLQTQGWLGVPVHAIVPDAALRCRAQVVRNHVVAHLPPETRLIFIAPGVWCSPPELVFVQLAETLPYEELLQVGFELCGSYRFYGRGHAAGGAAGHVGEARPLVNSKQIIAYAAAAQRLLGAKTARSAASHVLDRAASPRQTQLALLFSMPLRRGGYGFEPPVLNASIDLGVHSRAVPAQRFFTVDLLWPKARLAINYGSGRLRGGSLRSAASDARRRMLLAAGVETIPLTESQLFDRNFMDRLADHLARRLGKSTNQNKYPWSHERTTLRLKLLGHV